MDLQTRPLFIALEGLDGAGKSSSAGALSAHLTERYGANVLVTCEPKPEACGGDFIRSVLARRITTFRSRTLALAFAANRLDHCDRIIDPWLRQAGLPMVITDRYYLSSLVYQQEPDFPFDAILQLNELAKRPDVIFFLQASQSVCHARMKQRNLPLELFEENLAETRLRYIDAIDFLRKTRQDHIVVIDADGPPASVVNAMAQELDRLFRNPDYRDASETGPDPKRGIS
ncbi:MAG: hypothetical protein RLY31_2863 [Bacteroidota bacterium]|jgi:dTMP kinase